MARGGVAGGCLCLALSLDPSLASWAGLLASRLSPHGACLQAPVDLGCTVYFCFVVGWGGVGACSLRSDVLLPWLLRAGDGKRKKRRRKDGGEGERGGARSTIGVVGRGGRRRMCPREVVFLRVSLPPHL